ncbi:hypothetical protein ABT115_08845 [Streptomyces sp. NPDC001832]|uniref:hypothetical protein n=1 Tax=Streptomyces sp. NPDC001832 TaxID=3154527 RepID=UPI00331AC14D
MSRKYPKKVRKEYAAKLKAAEAFVESWTTSELSHNLIKDYDCVLGCEEAKTYAGLFRTFGYPNTAEQILADHGEGCENPHYHEPQGVWTFTIRVGGPAVKEIGEPDPAWTIVADGKNGEEAEERATEFLRRKIKEEYSAFFYIEVDEVENGVPGSTALYSWTDIREAA